MEWGIGLDTLAEIPQRRSTAGLHVHSRSPQLFAGARGLRDQLNTRRTDTVDAFELRLKAAQVSLEMAPETDIRGPAWFLANTVQGMSIQARAGATRKDLVKISQWSMKAWPANPEHA